MSDNATEEQTQFVYPALHEQRLKNQLAKAIKNPTLLTNPKSTGRVGEAHRAGIKMEENALLPFWRDVDRFAEAEDILHKTPADIAFSFLQTYGVKYWGSTSTYKASSSGFRYPPDNGQLKTPLWRALKRLFRYKLQCIKQKNSRPSQSQDNTTSIKHKLDDEPDEREHGQPPRERGSTTVTKSSSGGNGKRSKRSPSVDPGKKIKTYKLSKRLLADDPGRNFMTYTFAVPPADDSGSK